LPVALDNLMPRSVGTAIVGFVCAFGGAGASSGRVSASRNSSDPAGGTNGITDEGPAGCDAIGSTSGGAGGGGGGGAGATGSAFTGAGRGGGGAAATSFFCGWGAAAVFAATTGRGGAIGPGARTGFGSAGAG